jgi:hypothetical protein
MRFTNFKMSAYQSNMKARPARALGWAQWRNTMKLKRGVKLPTKSLFPELTDPPSVAKGKSESPLGAKANSEGMKRKRRKQLFY